MRNKNNQKRSNNMPAKQAKQNKTNNEQEYQIRVFGKVGCDKCALLEKRLENLLAKEEWQAFQKVKFDLGTEDGLVEFASLECLNPQRVPGFVVARKNKRNGEFEVLPNLEKSRESGKKDICSNSRLYSWLGLQTDYTPQGQGVLSPKMIAAILKEAKQFE